MEIIATRLVNNKPLFIGHENMVFFAVKITNCKRKYSPTISFTLH